MFPLNVNFTFIKVLIEYVLIETAIVAWHYFLGMKGKPEMVQLPGQGPWGRRGLCLAPTALLRGSRSSDSWWWEKVLWTQPFCETEKIMSLPF